MKWETAKKQTAVKLKLAILQLDIAVGRTLLVLEQLGLRTSGREALRNLADQAFDLVMEWDVTEAERLRACAADWFPAILCWGRLMSYQDENGEWHVQTEGTP